MNTKGRNVLLAVVSLILVIVMIAVTFSFRKELGWWAFIDCFTLFMTVFSWLMSMAIGSMIPYSGKVLQKFAIVFLALTVVAWIVEYFLYSSVG